MSAGKASDFKIYQDEYYGGMYEAVQQIRGEAEHRQIDRHDLGLVAGQLGYISAYSSALVLAGA